MRKINYLVIHHSYSPMKSTTNELINEWHYARWNKRYKETGNKEYLDHCRIQYHWTIDSEGQAIRTNADEYIGWHVTNMNSQCIGICVMGAFCKPCDEKPTNEQIESLIQLLAEYSQKDSTIKIRAHKDLQPDTTCPGDNLYNQIPFIKNEVNTRIEKYLKPKKVFPCFLGNIFFK